MPYRKSMCLVTFKMEKKPICWLLKNNEFIYRDCVFTLLVINLIDKSSNHVF